MALFTECYNIPHCDIPTNRATRDLLYEFITPSSTAVRTISYKEDGSGSGLAEFTQSTRLLPLGKKKTRHCTDLVKSSHWNAKHVITRCTCALLALLLVFTNYLIWFLIKIEFIMNLIQLVKIIMITGIQKRFSIVS